LFIIEYLCIGGGIFVNIWYIYAPQKSAPPPFSDRTPK
jgi:hypothetical protein